MSKTRFTISMEDEEMEQLDYAGLQSNVLSEVSVNLLSFIASWIQR